MKTSVAWLLSGLISALACACPTLAETVGFDNQRPGTAPAGWTAAVTGRGGSVWTVEAAPDAPSAPHVLKQSAVGTYPLCLKDGSNLTDGFVEVRFKAISGREDQAGGVVWRARDRNTYYVARANALENNVTIYHTIGGRRVSFESVDVAVAANRWHRLRVDFSGDRFTVWFDERAVIDATDDSISGAGHVGLWTKADSVTLFDDFSYGGP